MKKKCVVIGAGVAGLATAIRLSQQNYAVTVFEANAYPGGKLSAFTLGGYRFDAGPSLFTMPHFVDELFSFCGEDPTAHFNYIKKEEACRYFWEDGTALVAHSKTDAFATEVETKLGVPKKTLLAYLAKAKKKYDLTEKLFLQQSLHRWSTYFSLDTLKALWHIQSMEIGQSLDQVNREQLQEPHLVQLFNRFATYNGSSPYQTPGIMSLIQHLESHYGTFLPQGGMEQISQSLYRLAQRQGVQFHFDQKVDEILLANKKAVGVRVGTTEHAADCVVSNMDVFPTYKHLLPTQKMPKNVAREERSSSAVIFYWGIKKTFPQLDLHNIFFSDDYPAEFRAIFETKELYDDPTVYVNITSKNEKKDAPEGGENWFVMINAPADHGQDWDALTDKLREKVLAKLSRQLGVELSAYIEEETVMRPPEIQAKTQSHLGALYGSSSNNKMAAFLRHPNFSKKINGLFFCGGSVHPGGGIPLCLLSAKIVSEQIGT